MVDHLAQSHLQAECPPGPQVKDIVACQKYLKELITGVGKLLDMWPFTKLVFEKKRKFGGIPTARDLHEVSWVRQRGLWQCSRCFQTRKSKSSLSRISCQAFSSKILQVTSKAQLLGHRIWLCKVSSEADSERLIYCSRCGSYCHHRAQGLVNHACAATRPHPVALKRIREGRHPALKLCLTGHLKMPPPEPRAWSTQQQATNEAEEFWCRSAPQLQMADPPALGVVVFDKEELDKMEGRSWPQDMQHEGFGFEDEEEDLQEARAFDEGLWGPQQQAAIWE